MARHWLCKPRMVEAAHLGKCEVSKCTPAEVPMSRNTARPRTGNLVTSASRRAREAAIRLQPAAKKLMPLAKTARAAARQQANRTRAWAAPQVEKAGQVVQHDVAPKVSSLLSAAARRLEPEKPRRRWGKAVGLSAATAAASAFAAALRRYKKASGAAAAEDHEEADEGPSAANSAPAAETARATETGNGQRSPGGDVAQSSGTHSPATGP
jgi:hypothetical protein